MQEKHALVLRVQSLLGTIKDRLVFVAPKNEETKQGLSFQMAWSQRLFQK